MMCIIKSDFIRCRCQTYEGGFAGCPGLEAHGGYSFCGLAALVMLGRQHLCDVRALLVSYILVLPLITTEISFGYCK